MSYNTSSSFEEELEFKEELELNKNPLLKKMNKREKNW
jgi:hypothetical protein